MSEDTETLIDLKVAFVIYERRMSDLIKGEGPEFFCHWKGWGMKCFQNTDGGGESILKYTDC